MSVFLSKYNVNVVRCSGPTKGWNGDRVRVAFIMLRTKRTNN